MAMTRQHTGADRQSTHVVKPSVVPETCWPDGSPVSNWSKATQTLPGKRELTAADATFSLADVAA